METNPLTNPLVEVVQTVLSDPDLKGAVLDLLRSYTQETQQDIIIKMVSPETQDVWIEQVRERRPSRLHLDASWDPFKQVLLLKTTSIVENQMWSFDFALNGGGKELVTEKATIQPNITEAVLFTHRFWKRELRRWRSRQTNPR